MNDLETFVQVLNKNATAIITETQMLQVPAMLRSEARLRARQLYHLAEIAEIIHKDKQQERTDANDM